MQPLRLQRAFGLAWPGLLASPFKQPPAFAHPPSCCACCPPIPCLLCLQAMLVTCDRLLISEVRALEAEERATDVDTLLFQLAASEEYAAAAAAGSGQQGRERTPEDLQGGCTLRGCCLCG